MRVLTLVYSDPARKFCLRTKVTATTHFWGPDISRKGPCTRKREKTVTVPSFCWKVKGMKMAIYLKVTLEHPFLYTIEEIFGNKANSAIRMYAIKIVSNFFHLIFHFTVKICFYSLLLNCFASIHFLVTFKMRKNF